MRRIEQSVLDVTNCVCAIETALEHEDSQSLTDAAHRLKGISDNFGATPLQQLAQGIEQSVRQGVLPESQQLLADLQTEVSDITLQVPQKGK